MKLTKCRAIEKWTVLQPKYSSSQALQNIHRSAAAWGQKMLFVEHTVYDQLLIWQSWSKSAKFDRTKSHSLSASSASILTGKTCQWLLNITAHEIGLRHLKESQTFETGPKSGVGTLQDDPIHERFLIVSIVARSESCETVSRSVVKLEIYKVRAYYAVSEREIVKTIYS